MTTRIETKYLLEKGYLDAEELNTDKTRNIERLLSEVPVIPEGMSPEEFTAHVGEVIEEVNVVNVRPFARGGMGMIYLGYQFPPRFVADNKKDSGSLEELTRKYESSKGEFLNNHGFKNTDPLFATKYMRENLFLGKRKRLKFLQRFRREGNILKNVIKHSRVPPAISASDGVIVIKYLYNTETLYHLIKRGKESLSGMLKIAKSGAEILSDIHQNTAETSPSNSPVLHRDLKPENFLVDEERNAYAIDFGAALSDHMKEEIPEEALDTDDDEDEEESVFGEGRLTVTGEWIGTPIYSCPEEILGDKKDYDIRSEVFCYAATIYHALTGAPPRSEKTINKLMINIAQNKNNPEPAREIIPDFPKDLSNILAKAMEREPENRFQTMPEFYEELNKVNLSGSETQIDSKSRFSMPTQIDPTAPPLLQDPEAETTQTRSYTKSPKSSEFPTVSNEQKTISEDRQTMPEKPEKDTPTLHYAPKEEDPKIDKETIIQPQETPAVPYVPKKDENSEDNNSSDDQGQ